MSDWIRQSESVSDENSFSPGDIAAAVAAAAAECSAVNDFNYVPEIDLYFDRSSGYFVKKGRHGFHHGETRYTYSFNEDSYSWECQYNPEWDVEVGCPVNLDVFMSLSELLEKVQLDEIPETEPIYVDANEDDAMLPCVRAIVLESDHLDYGTLSIITVDGAYMSGSKEHGIAFVTKLQDQYLCRLSYEADENQFRLRVSDVKTSSDTCTITLNNAPVEENGTLLHSNDRLAVDCGETVGYANFSLHIHKATNTCAGCEPGLLLRECRGNTNEDQKRNELFGERARRKELKRLKSLYGLAKMDYYQNLPSNIAKSYTDRAEVRRQTVGSELPEAAQVAIAERQEPAASVRQPISETNRGYKMLQKMGWKSGTGVGKEENGMLEPICPISHVDAGGLGAASASRVALGDSADATRRIKWSKCSLRYSKLPNKNPINEHFVNEDDE